VTKRGEPVPRPPRSGEWRILAATTDAAKGWDDLAAQAPGPLATLYDKLTANPRAVENRERHGRLKGSLGAVSVKGVAMEQWQYEITGGGRVWFAPQDAKRTVWITWAGTGHPKATD
jgi:hypothetical protein